MNVAWMISGVLGRRARSLLVFLGGLAFVLTIHVWDPGVGAGPVCPFYAITGYYCPGCGTLRCLHALAHADLGSAIGYNAATVLLTPVLLLAWLSLGVAGIRGRPPPRVRSLPAWTGWAVATAFGLFWILRNVPSAPFSGLAP